MDASLASQVIAQLAAQAAVFLALLLAASALHKWLRWSGSARAVHEFARVPRRAAAATLAAVSLAELAAAGMLLGAHRRGGALLAAAILGIYLALILRALAAGRRDVDCGCSFGGTPHGVGAFQAWRNALLLTLALFAAAVAPSAAVPAGSALPPGSDGAPIGLELLAAAALLALYGALDQAMAIRPLRRAVVA